MKQAFYALLMLSGFAAATAGCRHKESFPELGDKLASPVDVALSDDQKHFYVLNADFDRTYNMGSLVVMDTDGNKLGHAYLPRMGRAVATAGNAVLVTTDQQYDAAIPQNVDSDSPPQAFLFDVSDPTNPVQKAQWNLSCAPFNAVMKFDGSFRYLAISCDGNIYLSQVPQDLSQTQLKMVRSYGYSRRALLLDSTRNLLWAFPTDTGKGPYADIEYPDAQTTLPVANPNAPLTISPSIPITPNDVPDTLEANSRVLSDTLTQEAYQFMVYDLTSEANPAITQATNPAGLNAGNPCILSSTEDCKFPWRNAVDPVAEADLRWVYFDLTAEDGSPDRSTNYNNPAWKYYRTNFFEAQPDPDDPDVFYLSQRGSPNLSPHANQIVRVRIKSDPHVLAAPAAGTGRWTPATSQYLSFERVYGFKGVEANKYVYPGSFKIAHINDKKVVVVNNFRDLVNWIRDDTSYSLNAQTLDDNLSWYAEADGNLNSVDALTYYQIALTNTGRAASCSFYGNAVILLDVIPGVGINLVNRIE